jgi:hypothetical protein
MATCASLAAELSTALSTFNSLNSQWGTTISSGINAARADQVNVARSNYNTVDRVLTNLEQLESVVDEIASQAAALSCRDVASQADSLLNRIEGTISAVEDGLSDLEDAISEAEERILESEEAAQSEDNAGDGTPGSAVSDEEDEDPRELDDGQLGLPPGADPDEEFDSGLEEPPIVTEPIPVIADDGSVVRGFARNPETGEVYATGDNTNQGLSGAIDNTRSQASLQDTRNFEQKEDWRVRLSLAPGAFYLYKDETNELLAPLRSTDGIIFPYTPTISVTYAANYQSVAPVHSNYKIFQYENSYVDTVSITCDFTAQDTEEAKYMLAVIHFLKSVTKMFYGQDFNPKPGTPPPLCYLFGLGEFQFNAHPLAITNFTYSLPNDVDYIRAGALTAPSGVSRSGTSDIAKPATTSLGSLVQNAVQSRLNQGVAAIGNAIGLNLQPGGVSKGYTFGASNRFNSPVPPGTIEPTYVPTKINISISAIPIVSRYEISSEFSVENYANGTLLRGTKRPGGGIW